MLSFELLNKECRGEQFDRLVELTKACLPKSVYGPSLKDSLRYLAGVTLGKDDLWNLCHRLAGNLQDLTRRRAAPPWSRQRFLEWVPLQVLSVRLRLNPRIDKPGATVDFRVMAGSPAPMIISKWWSLKYCGYLSTFFGFSRPVSHKAVHPAMYQYEIPAQFVWMRLYGLMDPDLSSDEPSFAKVRFPPSVLDWNREQLKYRIRIDKQHACPKHKPDDLPCHHCPIGYDECRAATHPRKYVSRHCPECSERSPFDEALSTEICINCLNRRAYRRRRLL